MIIKWLEDAIHDLYELRQYISQDKPSAANRVAKRILSTIDHLPKQPAIGRPGRVPGTRELIVPGTPFIVPYRVQKGALEVLRVLHGTMEWPEKL